MLKEIKKCFAVVILSLNVFVASHAACHVEDVEDWLDLFWESHNREFVCYLQVIIDHHRKHGVSEESRKKVMELAHLSERIGWLNRKGDLRELEKLLFEGVFVDKNPILDESGKVIDFNVTLLAFGTDADFAKALLECNELANISYESALSQLKELFNMAYQECERLTALYCRHDEAIYKTEL